MAESDSASVRSHKTKLEQLQTLVGGWLRLVFGAFACVGIAWWVSKWFAEPLRKVTSADWFLLAALLAAVLLVSVQSKLASRVRQRFLFLGLATLVALLMLETYIRVFDPFPILLRGGRISLPVNMQRQFTSDGLAGLEDRISVRFNSLGFRGAEPPQAADDWNRRLTIVCVGGSTTQCLYLSEGATWPDRLATKLQADLPEVWVNNAGIDGHSTFGHIELLEQYLAPLRPKWILFYVGLNDVDRSDLNASDLSTLRTESQVDDSAVRVLQRGLLRSSDAFALLDNFRMQWQAQRRGLTHGEPIAHAPLGQQVAREPLTEAARTAWLQSRDPACLAGYKNRVRRLAERCGELGIRCVLITQAVLYGEGVDDQTGMDLERVRVGEVDGAAHWQLLKRYNQATAAVAAEMDVPLIDLGEQMPKSSRYFYDLTHFNNQGAEKAASLLFEELSPLLHNNFHSNR